MTAHMILNGYYMLLFHFLTAIILVVLHFTVKKKQQRKTGLRFLFLTLISHIMLLL